jgi:hypothetical protein
MEKIPGVESSERPPRFRTIEKKVIETLPTGESVEEVLECNGLQHRRCVDKVTYDSSGEIVFVDQLSRVELGPCNHSHD